MKSICVFCGSSLGSDSEFINAATEVGKLIAESKMTLVYGGANVGLMGAVASAALEAGGEVIGVMPKFLAGKEIAHKRLTKMILTESMHDRKTKMYELSEGFVALPGGYGTLEEVSELLTWQQLGLHKYPIGFLNVSGFYDHLNQFFAEMERSRLRDPDHREMALFSNNISDLLGSMSTYVAPDVTQWIEKGRT